MIYEFPDTTEISQLRTDILWQDSVEIKIYVDNLTIKFKSYFNLLNELILPDTNDPLQSGPITALYIS